MSLPLSPPIEPMLARAEPGLPDGDGWVFEPKWDGFRALVFVRGSGGRGEGGREGGGEPLYLQSRDTKPLLRYFPELEAPLLACLPEDCVVDGEIVIAGPDGLDFDALLQRIHPARSRVEKLARETPASFVAWDLLALGDLDLTAVPFATRRARLEELAAGFAPPVYLTPATADRAVAGDWFARFEGAGLDGVMAKRKDGVYEPGKRVMVKVKHARTADCVVTGFRWHKNGPGTEVGSLILGLYDDQGGLHHVGVASSFAAAARKKLAAELEPLRAGALEAHPWREWQAASDEPVRRPDAHSRWNAGKDLSWEPLRLELVAEVAYDHMQGDRFRHATQLRRWRPDKRPQDCRYDQLEATPPAELAALFSGATREARPDPGARPAGAPPPGRDGG